MDEKPEMKTPERRRDDVALRVGRGVGRVERPPRVDATRHEGVEREDGATHVDVEAREVEPREGQVLGPDHQRDQEVPEHRRNGGDQEEEDHDDPWSVKTLL